MKNPVQGNQNILPGGLTKKFMFPGIKRKKKNEV
jgi:hypothetical protein